MLLKGTVTAGSVSFLGNSHSLACNFAVIAVLSTSVGSLRHENQAAKRREMF